MSNFEEIIKSKTLLGLPHKTTLKEVKSTYRNLMKKWHPDKHKENEKATLMSAKINKAYKIILEYIENYEYSFDEEEIRKRTETPHEWWSSRFN